jgi:hypothetical protein
MALAATVSCNDRRKLAERFAIATRAYSDAVAELATHRGTTSEPEYHRLQAVVNHARRESENTGQELQLHIAMHGC